MTCADAALHEAIARRGHRGSSWDAMELKQAPWLVEWVGGRVGGWVVCLLGRMSQVARNGLKWRYESC